MVGVEPGLRESVEPLAGHHACHRCKGAVHLAQLRQEEGRTQEPDLRGATHDAACRGSTQTRVACSSMLQMRPSCSGLQG